MYMQNRNRLTGIENKLVTEEEEQDRPMGLRDSNYCV